MATEHLSLAAHLRSLANPIEGPLGPGRTPAERGGESIAEGQSFADYLQEQLGEVNELQTQADSSINALATGQSDDVHATMIAMQKADVSFRLLMAVRNKLLDAYDEVMRMQI